MTTVFADTLEKLERGEMVKDYNANTTGSGNGGGGGADSEDEDDPKSPTSISSQSSSQGYDSAGSDFVDIEGFASIPDSSLPELQLQVLMDFLSLLSWKMNWWGKRIFTEKRVTLILS